MGRFVHLNSMSDREKEWRFSRSLTYNDPPPEAPFVTLVRLPILDEARREIVSWSEDQATGNVIATDIMATEYTVLTRTNVQTGHKAFMHHIMIFFSHEEDFITFKLKFSDTLNFSFQQADDTYTDCWRSIIKTAIPISGVDWRVLPIQRPIDQEYFALLTELRKREQEILDQHRREREYQRIIEIEHQRQVLLAKKEEEELKAKLLAEKIAQSKPPPSLIERFMKFRKKGSSNGSSGSSQ